MGIGTSGSVDELRLQILSRIPHRQKFVREPRRMNSKSKASGRFDAKGEFGAIEMTVPSSGYQGYVYRGTVEPFKSRNPPNKDRPGLASESLRACSRNASQPRLGVRRGGGRPKGCREEGHQARCSGSMPQGRGKGPIRLGLPARTAARRGKGRNHCRSVIHPPRTSAE